MRRARALAGKADSDTRTALCATTRENLATILGCHACTETVGVDATAATWLIRTFHDDTRRVSFVGLKMDGKYTTDQLIFVTPGGNGLCCPSTLISPYWFSYLPMLSASA